MTGSRGDLEQLASQEVGTGARDVHVGEAAGPERRIGAEVHELPVDGCPFARGVDHQLATVSARVERGAIDASRLAPAYQRYAPPRLLELLVASRPAGDEDLVVVHGSYGLGGVHLEHGAVTGYADVGRAGVADRYVDLAIAARELAHTISPEALGPFFVEYGIDYPDLRKIDFYVLLDELV